MGAKFGGTNSRKGSSKYTNPTYGQSSHIIKKFGGESTLAKTLTEAGWPTTRFALYRWGYRPPAGTNGLIPNHQRARIQAISRVQGVLLTEEDWHMRREGSFPTPDEHAGEIL